MKSRSIVLTLAVAAGLHLLPARAAEILVVLSDESRLELKDGKSYETGFYLNELMQPVRAFIAAGHRVTYATPRGRVPAVDRNSLDKRYFGDSEEALKTASDGLALTQLLDTRASPVMSLPRIRQIGWDRFAAVYLPGGHAPMQDLLVDPELGALLRHFHAQGKITALECHGPVALLSALPRPGDFVQAMTAGSGAAQPGWIYAGYRMAVFSDAEEKRAVPTLMPGSDMKFYPEAALAVAGARMDIGAEAFASHVVEDGELITGQNPASAPALAQAVLRRLN